MRNLFSNPLGASCAPIGNFKRLGLDALGSVFGTIMQGYYNESTNERNAQNVDNTNIYNDEMNKRTNETNLKIAEEANKANKQLQDEQNAWNLEQWYRQNEYNAPAQQVARLKAAGINPAAVLGNGSMVPASSLTSAPSQPQVVPEMKANLHEPYIRPQSNWIQSGVNAFADAMLKGAQVEKLGNDVHLANEVNRRENELQPWRVEQLSKIAKKEGALGDLAKQNLAYEQAAMKFKIAALQGDLRTQSENFLTMQQQRENMRLNNKLAEVQLAYAPKMNEAQLKQYYGAVQQIKAQIGLINANKLLTDEQRLHEIEKKTSTIIDNGLKALDFNVKDQMKETIMNTIKYDANFKKWSSIGAEKDARSTQIGAAGKFSWGYKDNFFDFGY